MLLFDGTKDADTGALQIEVDRSGVRDINFVPLKRGFGWVKDATPADGAIDQKLIPPARRQRISAVNEPRPEWIAARVPTDAIISPHSFGSLTLVGFRVAPDCRSISKRRLIFVETYWTIDQPVKRDVRLQILGVPERECRMKLFGAGMMHQPCDWQFPVERWTPGVIYRERIGLIPPARLSNIDVRIEVRVWVDGKFSAPFVDPQLISARFPHTPFYRTQFPDIILQSTPGKCWTAAQLAAVTGGRWLV